MGPEVVAPDGSAKERLVCASSAVAKSRTSADNSGVDRRAAFEASRSGWAAFELTFEQYSVHLDRLGWSDRLPSEGRSVYLCAACSLGLNAACRALDGLHFPELESALTRRFGGGDWIDDVLQQTRERLLVGPAPRIATYRGEGPLQSWLLCIATRIAVDAFRRDTQRYRVFARDWQRHLLEPPAEDDGAHGCLLELERALTEALTQLCPGDRQLLYMHYVQKLKIEQLAECLGVYRSTVYRRLRQIEQRVEHDCARSMRAQTGISSRSELRSLLSAGCREIRVDAAVWNVPEPASETPDGHGEAMSFP